MSNIESKAQVLSRELISVSLTRLREMQEAGYVGRRLVSKISIESPGTMTMPSEYRPDWSIASLRIQFELEGTPAFKQFEQAVEEDSLLGARMNTMIGTSRERRRMSCQDFFQVLLSAALNLCADDLQLSRDRFNEMWISVTESLLANSVRIKYWCALENVRIPEGSTEILPDVCLRGLNTRDIEGLWNRNQIVQSHYPFYGAATPSIMDVQALLETTTVEPVVIGESDLDPVDAASRFRKVQSDFEAVVTCVRLLRPERITLSPIFVESDHIWGTTSAHGNMEWRGAPHGGRCKLSELDLREVQELLKIVRCGETVLSRATMICLRRLGFASMRISIEDKLLDIVMALEAMVLSGSGDPKDRGELSFRLAVYVAKFLGGDRQEQRAVYEKVRTAYRLRSKIVHGDQLDARETASISESETIAKTAVRKHLHLLAAKKPVDWNAIVFD